MGDNFVLCHHLNNVVWLPCKKFKHPKTLRGGETDEASSNAADTFTAFTAYADDESNSYHLRRRLHPRSHVETSTVEGGSF